MGSEQHSTLWICKTLTPSFFDVECGKKAKAILKQHQELAQDFQRRLWPGVDPSMLRSMCAEPEGKDSKDFSLSCMDTRLMLSYVGHMISYQKRSKPLRHKAFQLLKALVEAVAKLNVTFQFLLFDPHGQGEWSQQRLQDEGVCKPWRQDFFNQFLALTWTQDLHCNEKLWVRSPYTRVHLADFIAFALDFPPYIQRKVNANLRWAKQCLERTALTILAQLADIVDNHVTSLTSPMVAPRRPRRRTGSQRLNKMQKWQLVASAMESILQREETRHVSAPDP